MRLSRNAAAIDAAAFAQAIAAFAPFEPEPVIAVAVSGGPDSMALALLLDAWVRERGGRIEALTVDHGLRTESAEEALLVGRWLGDRGIAHAILSWEGAKPGSGIQEAARGARYALLAEACAARGILHLAVAHHADDQAETIMFRKERSSGTAGMAGMTACRSLGAVMLVRPLLAWPKAALVATCRAARQAYVDDPSNRAPRFARTTARGKLSADKGRRDRLLAEGLAAGTARGKRETALAAFLGRATETRPDGVVMIDFAAYAEAPTTLRRSALQAALRTVGGVVYSSIRSAVVALDRSALQAGFSGASLAGCLVNRQRGRLIIVREAGRIGAPVPLAPGRWTLWDGRYRVRLVEDPTADVIVEVGPLGSAAYAKLRKRLRLALPSRVGSALAAAYQNGRLVAVPGLGWAEAGAPRVEQRPAPLWPLVPETFTVVYADGRIICHDAGTRRAAGS